MFPSTQFRHPTTTTIHLERKTTTDKLKRKVTTVGNRKTNKILKEVKESSNVTIFSAKDVGREATVRAFHADSVIVSEVIEGINAKTGVENRYRVESGVPIGETLIGTSKETGAEHAASGYSERR